eukprot:gene8475-biopygen3368
MEGRPGSYAMEWFDNERHGTTQNRNDASLSRSNRYYKMTLYGTTLSLITIPQLHHILLRLSAPPLFLREHRVCAASLPCMSAGEGEIGSALRQLPPQPLSLLRKAWRGWHTLSGAHH